ncbi:hypothetical protein BJ546DRAFT_1058010 [Cryomyces antarcticus]
MHSIAALAFLASSCLVMVQSTAVPASLERRSVAKLMIFDCVKDGLGDVCDNMCFGANCHGWGDSFIWDKPSKSTAGKRSTKAGCGSGNRCSKAPYGSAYQCDEYPFKSVEESDKGGQVNRCVKSEYNNAQSQVIRNFYNSYAGFKGKGCGKTAPCHFAVVFANARNIGYCNTTPNCKNDGNEYTKDGKVPDPKKREAPTGPVGGYYKLASGDVVYAPTGAEVGAMAYRTVRRNETLYDEHNRNHEYSEDQGYEQYDYMMDNLELAEDVVVAIVDGPQGSGSSAMNGTAQNVTKRDY